MPIEIIDKQYQRNEHKKIKANTFACINYGRKKKYPDQKRKKFLDKTLNARL